MVRKTGGFDRAAINQKISIKIKEQWGQKQRIASKLSKEQLKDLYCTQKMSMGDIAGLYNCSRVYIMKLLWKYGLPIRTKSAARGEAKRRGKNVGFNTINEDFFKSRSPEMAYVLGFIYADGNLGNQLNQFSISQKEPEILYKIKDLMSAEHKVTKKRDQELYTLTIGNKTMISDLLALGLTPNKSMDVKFPVLDTDLYSHFIRGYFDGDGSIYFSKTWRVNFICGSKCFIEDLENLLHKYANTSKRPINTHIYGRVYEMCYFRIADLMKIFTYFYNLDMVKKGLFLQRKYEIFKKVFDLGQRIIANNVYKRDRRYKL